MTLALRYAARSHVGLVRSGNEDSGYAAPTLLVVADGMGGHAAGELASAAAVATFASIDSESDHARDDVLTELAGGIERTTDEIRRVVIERPQLTGMGTTLTALAWRDGVVNLVHVGDSRAYLLRDGELQQMTHDHTYVQMLVDTGRITPDEALTHPRRNLILRALDGTRDVEPDLQASEARLGDRFLLCSDGLCGVVPEATLAALLGEGDPTYAVTALVEAALEAGAPDNVTAVVAEVIEADEVELAALLATPAVVVGSASDARTRERLSSMHFPDDVEPALSAERDPAAVAGPVELVRDTGTQRGGRRWWILVAGVLVVLVLLLAALSAARSWIAGQYFVAASNGQVVIFQGLNQSIPGLSLSSVAEEPVPPLPVDSLPDADRTQVDQGITAGSLPDAQARVATLRAAALACVAHWQQGCPGTAPAPTPLPTPTSITSPSPAPSGSIS